MPTIDQIFPKTIVAENPYTTQPKSLSKNCVKLEERTSLTPRIEILLDKFPTFKSFLEYNNPSRQFEIVKHPYKYLFGNSPTLSEVNIAYQNNECSNIWLIRMFQHLVDTANSGCDAKLWAERRCHQRAISNGCDGDFSVLSLAED